MKNIKTDSKIIARRGIDSISAKVLNDIYRVYPRKVTVKILAKNLKVRERYGIPVEINISKNNEKEVKASMKEPISWIVKEKESAEKMLELLSQLTLTKNEDANNIKNINHRIYKEYVNTLNELFDKWISLKLIDQLEQVSKD